MDIATINALKNQGLTTLREHLLFDLGVEVEVENTGGHCMALITYVTREEVGQRYVEDVVAVAGEGDGTYYVNRFPLDVWHGESEHDMTEFEPEKAVVYGLRHAVARFSDLLHRDH